MTVDSEQPKAGTATVKVHFILKTVLAVSVNRQPSTVNRQLSTVNRQLSTVNRQLTKMSFFSSKFVHSRKVLFNSYQMRLLLIFLSFLFIATGVRSQHHHFFYIQSDQQQPFYIKLGNEVMSSSSAGFLIIPKLKDSAFEMIVGFPNDQFPGVSV